MPDPLLHDFRSVAAATDFDRLVSDLNGSTDPSRRLHTCPLPDHQDSDPSFGVFLSRRGKPLGKCFGCGWSGDVLDLLVAVGRCANAREAAGYLVDAGYANPAAWEAASRRASQPGRDRAARGTPRLPGGPAAQAGVVNPPARSFDTATGGVWHSVLTALIANASSYLRESARPEPLVVRQYLYVARRLGIETVKRYGLGFQDRDAWSRPVPGLVGRDGRPRGIFCPRGIVIPRLRPGSSYDHPEWGGAMVRRLLPDLGPASSPKYTWIKGSETGQLYPDPGLTADGRRTLLVVEGEFDSLLGLQELAPIADSLGLAVTTLGSAAARGLSRDTIARIDAFPQIYLAFDDDWAGDGAAGFWKERFPRATRLNFPGSKDLSEFVASSGGDALRRGLTEMLSAGIKG